MSASSYPFTCTVCGREGSEEDGCVLGWPCPDEDCAGMVRLSALDDLRNDGDTVELDETHTLVLHIEHDPDSSIRDADCWGTVEQYAHDYCGREARAARPPDMDGSARKLQVDRGAWIWWMPREDLKSPKRWARAWRECGMDEPMPYAQALREHENEARRLLEEGFSQVGLELRETVTDSRGHEHAVTLDTAWLGGIDSLGNGYLLDVLTDLFGELDVPALVESA